MGKDPIIQIKGRSMSYRRKIQWLLDRQTEASLLGPREIGNRMVLEGLYSAKTVPRDRDHEILKMLELASSISKKT